ncbi:pathogenesis-related protein 5-like [Aphidius gifuensis]|uniref:pathogenesis-related protein 5-like n=1 Tax=Aphidius gifuensis TaxID=684658 RepID=UPI001CDB576D|nr:pathogenesis-related protein 5-like [Aphidius gifuensis]
MEVKFLLSFLLMIVGSFGNQLKLYNNCPFTVWPAIQGNPGKAHLEGGGFQLGQYEAKFINTPGDWAGRIWARTNCDGSGRCETGDCGNKIQCNGAGGVPPASLAEVTLKGADGLDFYDISLVDGYNLPIRMTPTGGYVNSGNGQYDCKAAGCYADLNAQCPNELAIRNSGGSTVACKSACAAFNTDQYCCRGAHNTPQTCRSSDWPVNYPAIFKSACPDAYSYAYDDTTSTFTCRGSPDTSYDIVFCP